MSKPRVVITGAAGFIGSHLSETLLDRGYAVVGIDNLLTGDLANIAHLTGRDFVFVKHDVTNYIDVDGPVDFVLHWASPASPIDYLELPIQTLKVGALGTHKALGLAKAKGARFVLASTSEVYGDPLVHPQRETLLGQREPHRPARRLRRGEAVRRGHDRRLPPLSRRRRQDRPHLQHLRAAGCGSGTGGRCRTSSPRRYAARTSRCTATARRRGASATSATSSTASSA